MQSDSAILTYPYLYPYPHNPLSPPISSPVSSTHCCTLSPRPPPAPNAWRGYQTSDTALDPLSDDHYPDAKYCYTCCRRWPRDPVEPSCGPSLPREVEPRSDATLFPPSVEARGCDGWCWLKNSYHLLCHRKANKNKNNIRKQHKITTNHANYNANEIKTVTVISKQAKSVNNMKLGTSHIIEEYID